MAAVLGLDEDAVARAIAGTGCVVANDNAPGQVVISGPREAVERASARLAAAGARRVLPLKVSAAFHSPAMRRVADELAGEMALLTFRDAAFPVVCNVDAQPRTRGGEFPQVLAQQVYSPVRWVAVVRRMHGEGVRRFIEFGAGTVLAGLVKRIVSDVETASVQDPATLGEAGAALR